jgi:hypothetical protein
MDRQIAFVLHHPRKSPTVRQREFSLTYKTAKYRDNVLWSLVSLVDDEHASVCDGTQQWRVCVANHPAFQCGLEHEMLYSRVAVELDVLPRPLEKLQKMRPNLAACDAREC